MENVFTKIDDILEKAERAAEMESASFGFPDDKIEIKSVHFGDDDKGHKGDTLHPTEYVKNVTRLYRKSWIVNPIKLAREFIKVQEDLFIEHEKLVDELSDIVERAREGND